MRIKNAQGDIVVIISAHCFHSSINFVTNAARMKQKHNYLASIYGCQYPIPYIDPFEEYELSVLCPDHDFLEFNAQDVYEGKIKGVSNACCILRKDVWRKIPFREDVQSLEDGYWVFDVVSKNFKLAYTNRIGVYHSHSFDPELIYRRWYWRTFESLTLLTNVMETSFLDNIKQRIKPILYPIYLQAKMASEAKKMAYLLTSYNFIDPHHIKTFIRLKNFAIKHANNDLKKMQLYT